MATETTRIRPSVLVKDEYGNEQTVYPPGWMYVLAFALKGIPWAVAEIESGRLDRAVLDQQANLWTGDGI